MLAVYHPHKVCSLRTAVFYRHISPSNSTPAVLLSTFLPIAKRLIHIWKRQHTHIILRADAHSHTRADVEAGAPRRPGTPPVAYDLRTNTIERPIPTVPGAACAWFRTSHGRTAVWTVLPADAHSHTRAEVEEGPIPVVPGAVYAS